MPRTTPGVSRWLEAHQQLPEMLVHLLRVVPGSLVQGGARGENGDMFRILPVLPRDGWIHRLPLRSRIPPRSSRDLCARVIVIQINALMAPGARLRGRLDSRTMPWLQFGSLREAGADVAQLRSAAAQPEVCEIGRHRPAIASAHSVDHNAGLRCDESLTAGRARNE